MCVGRVHIEREHVVTKYEVTFLKINPAEDFKACQKEWALMVNPLVQKTVNTLSVMVGELDFVN